MEQEMSPQAAPAVPACSLAHLQLTWFLWLVLGGKLSVVLRAEAISEILLQPSTSSLAKVMTISPHPQ